jgi:CHAT domain-containing protein
LEDGGFLGDRYEIVQVGTASELVPWPAQPEPGRGALLLGSVDYEAARAGETTPEVTPGPLLASGGGLRAPRGKRFLPLPATAKEVSAIAGMLPEEAVATLLGGAASEARLRALARGRRILHLATHGFVRTDLPSALERGRNDEEPLHLDAGAERHLVGYDPMLLCGLALAGATTGEGGGGDDGILTALEAQALDLAGCELAVLSACDTAGGTERSGEGILGLVRAFRQAGAENVVASLWPVDDEATRRLMTGFYERWLAPERPSAAAALRAAARALRETAVERDGRSVRPFAAPRFWAAFVAYGTARGSGNRGSGR